MLLTIDVGNTQTVFGLYDGTRIAHHFRTASDRRRTKDEYAVLLRELLHDVGLGLERINAAALASVVPPLTPTMVDLCRARLKLEPVVVGPGVKSGMSILYENPREVGADRIVNGVAGYERYRQAPGGPHGVIVVDFGTATTFDVVSPKGEYLGGAISPGVNISLEALFQHASKLPRVELQAPPSCLGKTTVTSMQSGIIYGYAALVDGMIERLSTEVGFSPRVIATGGIAGVIAKECRRIEEVDGFLTLEGLRIIYERNARA